MLLQQLSAHNRAAAIPAIINRPPACLAAAPPVNGRTVLTGGTIPDEAAVPTGAEVAVGEGVTVMTLVMTVGTQVVMAMVLRIGAGVEEGGLAGVVGGATTELVAGAEGAEVGASELVSQMVVVEVDMAATVEAGELIATVPLDKAEVVGYGTLLLVSVAVTGQMVVYSEMMSVVTWPTLAGQSVTVAAQEVTV
jgi:hypothetical protein